MPPSRFRQPSRAARATSPPRRVNPLTTNRSTNSDTNLKFKLNSRIMQAAYRSPFSINSVLSVLRKKKGEKKNSSLRFSPSELHEYLLRLEIFEPSRESKWEFCKSSGNLNDIAKSGGSFFFLGASEIQVRERVLPSAPFYASGNRFRRFRRRETGLMERTRVNRGRWRRSAKQM